jgi:PBSX family phage terminase large subunit
LLTNSSRKHSKPTISKRANDALLAEVAHKLKTAIEAREKLSRDFVFRGNNARLWELQRVPEIILSGPAGTGKTQADLAYIHYQLLRFPNSRSLFLRENMDDLRESTLTTWEEDILGPEGMEFFGSVDRQNRKIYQYPNGSRVVLGGLNNPGKWLSAQYDIIYVGEATQITLQNWEIMVTRTRNYKMPLGIIDGRMRYVSQIIGDTNPGPPTHWIKQREAEGKLLLLPTTHKDNPAYWDEEKQDWTDKGFDYVLGKLEALSGILYDRYKLGLWVAAEGAVYQFNDAEHLISPEEFAQVTVKYWMCSNDFGFRDPFVWHLWAVDTDDRMYLVVEIYMSERIVADHAEKIKPILRERLGETDYRMWIGDAADAEGIATLNRAGLRAIPTTNEEKDIAAGIQSVQKRLRVDATGKAALRYVKGALVERDQRLKERKHTTSTHEEFGAYLWDDKHKKEAPVDAYNHGMDALRYAVRAVELRGNRRILIGDD